MVRRNATNRRGLATVFRRSVDADRQRSEIAPDEQETWLARNLTFSERMKAGFRFVLVRCAARTVWVLRASIRHVLFESGSHAADKHDDQPSDLFTPVVPIGHEGIAMIQRAAVLANIFEQTPPTDQKK